MKLHAWNRRHVLRSSRLAPENIRLPDPLGANLRTLAQATIDHSLPLKIRHQGKTGRLTWALADDRFQVAY